MDLPLNRAIEPLHISHAAPEADEPAPSLLNRILHFTGLKPKPRIDHAQPQQQMASPSRFSLWHRKPSKPTLKSVLNHWVSQAERAEKKDRQKAVKLMKQSGAQLNNGKIVVKQGLDLDGYTGLTSLPDNLSMGGDLYLGGCTGMTSLPDNLRVGGNLSLSGCTGLTSLPDNLSVGGNLSLSGCTGLTSLPNWITRLGPISGGNTRYISISNTGLSEAILEQLRQANPPGMQFIESQQASQYIDYDSIEDALKSWDIDPEALDTKQWNLRANEKRQLTTFLSRMHQTSEATNTQTKSSFKDRVQRMIADFSNNHFRELAMTHIHDALSSCNDRILIVMDNIDITQRIEKAHSESIDSVETLGKAMYALELVDKEAQKHIDTQSFVDPIEVILALRIHCADQFDLPMTTRNMRFERCANLTPDIIQQAKVNVESALAKAGNIEAFLNQWQPLQQAKRKEASKKVEYTGLKQVIIQSAQQQGCCITGKVFTDMDKPILLATKSGQPDVENSSMIDMTAILRHWVEKEAHILTSEKMTLANLQDFMYRVTVK